MKKNKSNEIKIVVLNPPTKKQADNRIKELVAYLGKVWNNPQNTD